MKRCLHRHMQTGSSALKCFLLEAVETMPDPSRMIVSRHLPEPLAVIMR